MLLIKQVYYWLVRSVWFGLKISLNWLDFFNNLYSTWFYSLILVQFYHQCLYPFSLWLIYACIQQKTEFPIRWCKPSNIKIEYKIFGIYIYIYIHSIFTTYLFSEFRNHPCYVTHILLFESINHLMFHFIRISLWPSLSFHVIIRRVIWQNTCYTIFWN